MKKILITGANSYIGSSFEQWMNQYEGYEIVTVDMMDGSWRKQDFSKYDIVFHVAGIAHQKETKENAHVYYEVNRDLAIETATKAQKENVKQFIFLSSMSVYGLTTGHISLETSPNPQSNYGISKLYAEQGILELSSDSFKVAIIRPPMVYGKQCRGNYNSLSQLALRLPIFPKVNNCRSMIYIENLCEFVRLLINRCDSGIFFPQNKSYVNTTKMVEIICKVNAKKMHTTKMMNWAIWIGKKFFPVFNKVFGSLSYDLCMSQYYENYNCIDFEESIQRAENRN